MTPAVVSRTSDKRSAVGWWTGIVKKKGGNRCCCRSLKRTLNTVMIWAIAVLSVFGVLAPTNGEETSEVVGLVGEKADLPCDVDEFSCGKVYFITWTKNVSNEWKRLYLFSDQVEKPLQELANPDRADFKLMKSSAFLSITPLRIEDDGEYKCDVTYIQGKCPSLSYATLVIHSPPTAPVIEKDGKPAPNGSVVGPFYEGAALSLECETTGGKPTPEVTWYKGKEKLESEISLTIEKNGTSTIKSSVTMELDRDDLGERVECHVDNEATDEPLVTWVEIDLHVGPSSLEISGPTEPVIAGNDVILTCTIEGAKPEAEAVWYNRSEILDVVPQSHSVLMEDGTYQTVSLVKFPVSRHDHMGSYYCKGSNSVLQTKGEASLLKSLDIQVLYPPAVIVQPTGGIIVNESDSTIISCTYEANPFNITDILWFKGDDELEVPTAGKYEHTTQGYPTLTIRDVQKEDRGMYSCALSNAIGQGNATNDVEINVLYPPVVEAMISPEDVKEGNSISLFCDIIDGNPQNLLRVRWFRDNEKIYEITEREIVWEGVARNTTGNYSCEGENSAGWGERSEQEELIVNFLPGQATLTELEAPAVKGEISVLHCDVDDPGLPPATVYRWEKDGELLATTVGDNYTIAPIKLNTRGNYSCAAVNEVGVGPKGYWDLVVKAPPSFIDSLPDIRGVARDDPFISFNCRVECDPLCEVHWLKNDDPLPKSELYDIRSRIIPEDGPNNVFISISSTLQLNMTAWPGRRLERDRDRANYTCISTENEVGDGVFSKMLFVVGYAPESLSVSDSQVDVIEGNIPEEVKCSASSWPDSTFQWKTGDVLLAEDDTLIFNESVTRENAGKYICVAENRYGKSEIEMDLNVLYKPECSIEEEITDGKMTLVCRAEGNPALINFTWIKDNETMDDEDDIDEEKTFSTYVLQDSSERYGVYVCIAVNDIGESEPCELEIEQSETGVWNPEFGDKNVFVIAAVIGGIAIIFVLIIIVIIVIMRKRRLRNAASPAKQAPATGADNLYQNVSAAPADRKQNGPPVSEPESSVMYENMPFHRQGPYRPDSSDEMVYADLYDDVKAGKLPDPRIKPPLPPKGIGKKPKEPPLPPKTRKGGSDSLGI